MGTRLIIINIHESMLSTFAGKSPLGEGVEIGNKILGILYVDNDVIVNPGKTCFGMLLIACFYSY